MKINYLQMTKSNVKLPSKLPAPPPHPHDLGPRYVMGRSRGGDRGSGSPLENHKNMGFLSNTGPDVTLENHYATKPAFQVGPPSACQLNAM